MPRLKRLATRDDGIAIVPCPVSNDQLEERKDDYANLPPRLFNRKHGDFLYKSVSLRLDGHEHSLQVNFCTDPLCKWFGQPQARLGRGHRYKLVGSHRHTTQAMRCNEDPKDPGGVSSKGTEPMSNWSLAEEIARLAVNDRVVDRDPQYRFHRETCPATGITPFEHPGAFRKRGKSSSNSQKWQCKQCGKITNTLPDQKESFTYHQQRNEIVPRIAEEFIGRSPVRRTCEKLSIGSSTYYN